ncbi:histidine kinase [Streptomyces sp. NPDC006660]|uniref:histidine kinase n=1 Tax=Streptomyces sp. NPDC006660 TaxID=3156901 RepID=UPI0033D2C6E7
MVDFDGQLRVDDAVGRKGSGGRVGDGPGRLDGRALSRRTAIAITAGVLLGFFVIDGSHVWAEHPPPWHAVGAVLGFVAIMALQLLHSFPGFAGRAGRLRWATWLLLGVLAYGPVAVFGAAWGGMTEFFAASAVLVFPSAIGWPLFVCAVAGEFALFRQLGFGAGDFTYAGIEAVLIPLVVIGLSRMPDMIDQLHATREELSRLAVARERLRFARDLHEVLGRSLSDIALRCERARRLVVDAPAGAGEAVGEMLVVARKALSDVRSVSRGYRRMSLADEVASAVPTLSAAGIDTTVRHGCGDLPDPVDTVLAAVLGEGLTNLLRHSGAERCVITTECDGVAAVLVVANDGVGPGGAVPGAPMPARAVGGGVPGAPRPARAEGGGVPGGAHDGAVPGGVHVGAPLGVARVGAPSGGVDDGAPGGGLAVLDGRVRELGGTLAHGLDGEGWFRLRAALPLRQDAPRPGSEGTRPESDAPGAGGTRLGPVVPGSGGTRSGPVAPGPGPDDTRPEPSAPGSGGTRLGPDGASPGLPASGSGGTRPGPSAPGPGGTRPGPSARGPGGTRPRPDGTSRGAGWGDERGVLPRVARAITLVVLVGYFLSYSAEGWSYAPYAHGLFAVELCLLGCLALQLAESFHWCSPWGARWKGRLRYGALGAQAVLQFVPFLVFGRAWAGTPGFLAGSALLALPAVAAWPVLVLVTAASGAAQYALGVATQDVIYESAYTPICAVVVFGLTRMARLAGALHRSRAEVARLAVTTERLRFARDLHDLLGFSLSAITLKCELVRRIARDRPARAREELTEVLAIARAALSDVPALADGGGRMSLAAEAEHATALLSGVGIRATVRLECGELPDDVESVLATLVREGLTNMLRHSTAASCEITAGRTAGAVWLSLVNDGAGAAGDAGLGSGFAGGSGIGNLTARVESVNGRLTAGPRPGGRFELCAEVRLAGV